MSRDRWSHRAEEEISSRAFRKAQALGHSWCGIEHVLLALLDPPKATDAAAVLSELGLTQEAVVERLEEHSSAWSPGTGLVANPALHSLLGTATGLALAFGATQVTDEHVLQALVYGRYSQLPPLLVILGVDPDALVRKLADRGHPVPRWLPPESPPPPGPMGPRVYYPVREHRAVVRAMIERFPPGTAHWGFNVSSWKQRFHWIDAEESCRALEVIRAAVRNASVVEALPVKEAASREAASRAPPKEHS